MKIYDNQVGSFVQQLKVYAKSIISQYYFIILGRSDVVYQLISAIFPDSVWLCSTGRKEYFPLRENRTADTLHVSGGIQ